MYIYRHDLASITVSGKQSFNLKKGVFMYKNVDFNGNYFLLPNNIFKEKMKPREFIVYSYLKRCADQKYQCFPSRKNISENCCISLPTVDIALKNLENSGYIMITPRRDCSNGNMLSHLYTVQKI